MARQYGMSPGRSQAQYGHAGHAGKTEKQAQQDQRQGRDTPEQYQHITGAPAPVYGEHLKGLIEPPTTKDREALGPPLPPFWKDDPMFSTIEQALRYKKYLEELAEEEDRKKEELEILKNFAEYGHYAPPGFSGNIGPISAALTYEPEDPLGTYTIGAGINPGPFSLGYSTGANLDDIYGLGVKFPSGGVGLLTDEATGNIMGGGQISKGPFSLEGGFSNEGPEWAGQLSYSKPFRLSDLLRKKHKKAPAPYARGGIVDLL